MKKAVVEIDGSSFTTLLTQGEEVKEVRCIEGLPAGAEFVCMGYDAARDVFQLVYAHDSFADKILGQLPVIRVAYSGKSAFGLQTMVRIGEVDSVPLTKE